MTAEVESGKSLRTYLSTCHTALAVVAVAIFTMYLQTVLAAFAFTDDYPLLAMSTGLGSSPWFGKTVLDAYAINGRPVAGLLVGSLFGAAGTIDNLRFVRLVDVVGIVLLGFLLHYALVRSGVRSALAALLAVLVCSMPAFEVYSSWATIFASPFAALLGGVASVRVVAAVDGPRKLFFDRMLGGAVALILGLLVYQSAAMFFWIFLAIALIGSAGDGPRAVRLVRTHVGVGVVALAAGYVVVKLGDHFVGANAPNATRNALTHDVAGKVKWFLDQALYQALNLFDIQPSPWFAAIAGVVAGGGILLLIRERAARPTLYLAVALGLIPLSYLPNLVTDENVAWYRTQSAIASLMALYVGLGAFGIWSFVRGRLQRRLDRMTVVTADGAALVGATAFVVAGVVLAASNVHTYFVQPQKTELALVRREVARLPRHVSRVAFVRTPWDQGATTMLRYDEFGLPSTGVVWVLQPSVLLILRDQGRLTGGGPTVDIVSPDSRPPPGEPVIDVRGKLR